ncbi:hypothetical protein IW136_004443, partial [Coemansia sp. RSA 678]
WAGCSVDQSDSTTRPRKTAGWLICANSKLMKCGDSTSRHSTNRTQTKKRQAKRNNI